MRTRSMLFVMLAVCLLVPASVSAIGSPVVNETPKVVSAPVTMQATGDIENNSVLPEDSLSGSGEAIANRTQSRVQARLSDVVATPDNIGLEFRLCYAYCARKQVRAIRTIHNATRECIQACREEGLSDDEIFENATNETRELKPSCVAVCERKRIKAYKDVFELTKECREKCAEQLEELREQKMLTVEDLRARVRAMVEERFDERGRLVYRIRNRTQEPVDISDLAQRVRVTRKGLAVDGAELVDEANRTPPVKLKVFVGNRARHIVVKRLADKGLIQIDDNGTIVSTNANITIVNGTIMIEGINKTIKVTPSLVRARLMERLRNANLTEMRLEVRENKPIYRAVARKRARLLGLIPVDLQVETEVDAETGEVQNVKAPWWAFLAR